MNNNFFGLVLLDGVGSILDYVGFVKLIALLLLFVSMLSSGTGR
jgi:hypothetical protein